MTQGHTTRFQKPSLLFNVFGLLFNGYRQPTDMINLSKGGFQFPAAWVMGPAWTAMLSHGLCHYFKVQFFKKPLCKV